MQRQQDARRFFDLSDSFDIQVLLRFSLNHALEHTVHVAHRGSQDVDTRGLDELSGILRSRETL